MSLVGQKPICPSCGSTCSEFYPKAALAVCPVCRIKHENSQGDTIDVPKQFTWHQPPEPTIEELSLMLKLLERRQEFYIWLSDDQNYQQRVNEELDLINQVKARLDKLKYARENVNLSLSMISRELLHVHEQRKELINQAASRTRQINHERKLRSGFGKPTIEKKKPARWSEEKVRQTLGDDVYNQLRKALGSHEAVVAAVRGS